VGSNPIGGNIMGLNKMLARFTVLPIRDDLSLDNKFLELLLNEFPEQLESSFEILEMSGVSEVSFELPEDDGIITLILVDEKVDVQFEKNDSFLFTTTFQHVLEEVFDDYVKDHQIEEVLDSKFGKHSLCLANIDEIDEMIQSIY
jgi:hypothetical protein